VVTASLPIAMELGNEPGIRVMVTGGSVRSGELSLTGGFAEDMIRQVNCDLVFLGVAGVSATAGLSDYNPEDTRVKRLAIASARRAVVLADAGKLGRVAFSSIAGLDAIDTLVTDAWSTHPEIKRLAGSDVQIVHAEPVGPPAVEVIGRR
jgi:DeoR/GlpR family transcriptional regulator of sugar metabolism